MMKVLDVILSPSEIKNLPQRDLSNSLCVVFDILRATSTMVTALNNGATCIFPAKDIPEALEIKTRRPEVLLAGERNGLRIGADLTGGIAFDLGNSPREFTRSKIEEKTIVMTTTNGTRALCACANAARVLVGSFLNLSVTVEAAQQSDFSILLVCAGTEQNVAYEDVLCAGAFIEFYMRTNHSVLLSDSALIARSPYLQEQGNIRSGLSKSSNARRLLSIANLRDDVELCAQCDTFSRLVDYTPIEGVR